MRKVLVTVLLAVLSSANLAAQTGDSQWTVNTRAWSTNYFTSAIYDIAVSVVKHFAFSENERDSLWAERLIPTAGLVFPVGMGKDGIDCYGPYHRAFSNPFKHIGDYAIGLDASFKPSKLGFYAGAFFKSQEVVFKQTDENIRGFYIQPRAGIVIGGERHALEAGVFYDIVTGCKCSAANVKADTDMLKGGLGLDFGLSYTSESRKQKIILQFSMPLHNFFNPDFAGQQGLKRKVGYISLTRRVFL